jgi:hypothetical protein
MKSAISPLVVACAFAFAGIVQAAPRHDHDHASHASAPAAAQAQRFATDAPLRKGMAEVKAALSDLAHFEMGHMPANMASERAGDVARAVEGIFAECKLAPEADAVVHTILVPLLGAAKRLEQDSGDVAAVAAMRDAVASYPQRFDDPQWQGADEPAHAH